MSAEIITFYDGPEARCIVSIFWRRCYVHLTVKHWSVETYRFLRLRWPEVCKALRAVGVRRILTFPPNGHDPKWHRFAGLFGFVPTRTHAGYMIYEVTGA